MKMKLTSRPLELELLRNLVEVPPSRRFFVLARNSASSSTSRSAPVRRSDTASSLNSTWF